MPEKSPVTDSFDATSPWGRWAAQGSAKRSLDLVARLPRNWLFRRLAFILRKPVKKGRQLCYDREIWGLTLRLCARGNLTEQRWLTMEQFHDWPERKALRDFLKPGAVFLDVGANVGFYTFWALSQRFEGLRVVAVEPVPAMLERLRFNLSLNGFEGSVDVRECAVTPEPGEVVIAEHEENLGQSSVGGKTGKTVPGVPLKALLETAGVDHVDALKIDIEGHEIPVLEAFFKDAPKSLWPRLIIGEIVGEDGGAFQQLLVANGYALAQKTKMNGIFRLPDPA